jgi:hypothetical protein
MDPNKPPPMRMARHNVSALVGQGLLSMALFTWHAQISVNGIVAYLVLPVCVGWERHNKIPECYHQPLAKAKTM